MTAWGNAEKNDIFIRLYPMGITQCLSLWPQYSWCRSAIRKTQAQNITSALVY